MLQNTNETFEGVRIKIVNLLKQGTVGQLLPDEEIEAVIGIKLPKRKLYELIFQAISRCYKNHQVYWERVRGANAIKCLDDEEKESSLQGRRKKIGRAARKGGQIAGTFDYGKLGQEQAHRITALKAQFELVKAASSSEVNKQMLARGVTEVPKEKILEIFKK